MKPNPKGLKIWILHRGKDPDLYPSGTNFRIQCAEGRKIRGIGFVGKEIL